MPEDFYLHFSAKVQDDINNNRQEDGLSRRQSREFAAMTNFYTDNLIRSGKVLYGDPLSNMCQRIADKLSEYTELDRPVRIYTVKTNQVNAYSTNQGIIFVTIGLLARIENEAQLAFILAHEIGHIKERHSLQAYNDKNDLVRGRSSYRHLNMEDRILESYRYAREAESEADKIGFDLYTEMGYDPRVCISTFDMLLTSYLPLDERDVPWQNFETNGFVIPEKYRLDEGDYNEIELEEDIDDSELTHPNIKKRKEKIYDKLDENPDKYKGDTVFYKVSDAATFKTIRDLARFEMVNIYLRNTWYPMAYYTIQIIKEDYPDHEFLKGAELMSWAGMQIFINNSQKRAYSDGYSDYEGKQQGLLFWIYRTNKKEMNAVATKYVWENAGTLKDTVLANQLRHQTMRELASRGGLGKRFFIREIELDENGDTIALKKSKRKRRKHAYCEMAFLELFKDSTFAATYDQYHKDYKDDEEDDYDDEDFDESSPEYSEGYADSYSYRGVTGVEKLMMLTPRYFGVNLKKSLDKSIMNSDVEQQSLNASLKDVSDQLNVDIQFMDDRTDANFTTDQFNDYSQLTDWLIEESQYDGFDFYSFQSRNLGELQERYGTRYLAMSSIWTVKDRKPFDGGMLLATIFLTGGYLLPVYLIWQLQPMNETQYSFLVYDLESGNLSYVDYLHFPSKYRKDFINAHLYNSINQVSHK